MKSRVELMKSHLKKLDEQPMYAVAAKTMYAEKAITEAVELIAILTAKVEHLEKITIKGEL